MRRAALSLMALLLFGSLPGNAQQPSLEQELRAELARIKEQVTRIESLLERLEAERRGAPTPAAAPAEPAPPSAEQAPAMNTPPMMPPSRPAMFRKEAPRIDVMLQVRGDFLSDPARNDTFFLRKAEVGFKGHIAENVDFSLEFDPVRANDPYRRTYIRFTHLKRLHVKFGLEKAPLGLEELTSTAQVPFVDRSEVNDRFAAAEELGVHLESHWDRWLFQFAVTNGGRRLLRDDNDHKDVSARAVWGPRQWLSLGFATLRGEAGPERRARDRYNAEFKLGSNFTGLLSEFYRARDANVWSSAYYVGGYWAFPVRRGMLTHVQPALRYEQIGRSDRARNLELRLLTMGVHLLFTEHRSKLQFNYLKDLWSGTLRDEVRVQYQVAF